MSVWVAALLGFVGGLATLLLRMRHERAAELRTRMLEAADDFVSAYTTAREALRDAEINLRSAESFLSEDILEPLPKEWRDERAAADAAARAACDALKHRSPRIALLFGAHTPPHASGSAAYLSLSMVEMSLSLGPQESPEKQESEDERRSADSKQADTSLGNFSRQAREAILESTWSIRRLRKQIALARANRKAKRRAPRPRPGRTPGG